MFYDHSMVFVAYSENIRETDIVFGDPRKGIFVSVNINFQRKFMEAYCIKARVFKKKLPVNLGFSKENKISFYNSYIVINDQYVSLPEKFHMASYNIILQCPQKLKFHPYIEIFAKFAPKWIRKYLNLVDDAKRKPGRSTDNRSTGRRRK